MAASLRQQKVGLTGTSFPKQLEEAESVRDEQDAHCTLPHCHSAHTGKERAVFCGSRHFVRVYGIHSYFKWSMSWQLHEL